MWSMEDGLFGPQLPGHFDFTLFFEHVMLTIIPGGVVVLAIPFYLQYALRATRTVRSGWLLWLKLGVGLAMLGANVASLILWRQRSLFRSDIALWAAVMSLASSCSITVILYVAHTYALRPSAFLSVFLTITALFDITMARSYFIRVGLDTLGALQVTVAALKFVLVALEEVPKRNMFRSENLRVSVATETVVGFWNRAVFGWLNSLLLFGYRRELTIDDLPRLEEQFNCERLYDRFTPNWEKGNKTSLGLVMALLRTLRWEASQIIPMRLCFVGFIFSQPFLLFSVVKAYKNGVQDDVAHGLVGATALIFTGKAITRAIHEHASYRLVTFIRGILVLAIYDKMQRLPAEELANSAAVTLMTTDTAAIEAMFELLYEVSSSLVLVGLGIWGLSLFVERACFLMLIPGICSVIASHFLGITMTKARKAWNEKIESRVAATSNILAQIKSVKAIGLSDVMTQSLQEKRRTEVATSMQDRHARIWLYALAALSYVLSPLLVLTGAYFWTRVSNPMNIAEVFSVLTIINIATDPFITLLSSFMQWSGGLASLGRIQAYLCLDEIQDPRRLPDNLPDDTDPVTGEKKIDRPPQPHSMPFAIEFDLVTVTSAIMGSILKQVSFQIPWGNLAIFWGSINCGKSTLLRCVIGETKLHSGTVTVGTKSIAYCSQEPWMQNGTVRENITGMVEFIEDWYRQVLTCCGLDLDISLFPNGDKFITGTNGCNLSGGQKQRVSLARAVYSRTDILVVDDIFSALDPATAQSVFTALFGPAGLVRSWNCTVIMTTNHLHFLDDSDLIYRMYRGGRVEQQQHDISDDESAGEGAAENSANQDEGDNQSDDEAAPVMANQTLPADANALPSVQSTSDDLELKNAKSKRQHGDWSLYSYFLGAAGTFLVVFWIFFVAIAAVIQAMPFIFIRIWYSKDPENQYYFTGYAAFCAATIVFNSLAGAQYFFQIVPQSSEELHLRTTRTAIFATSQYLSQTDSGDLLNRFSQDISLISQHLPLSFMRFVYACFSVAVEASIVASGSPYTAPIIIFIFVVLYLVQYFYLRTSRQLRLLELESSSYLFTLFTETADGIRHIRSFGWQSQFRGRSLHALDRSQRPLYFLFCCQRWLSVVLDFTTAITSVLLVLSALSAPEETSEGAVGLALLMIIGFSDTASELIRSWTHLETGLGGISRIKEFCLGTPQESDTLSGPELEQHWPANGRFDFNCVNASYNDHQGTAGRALDNLTMTIQPGDKVGITGRTGSGKSSMFMTILRMVEFSGTISLDGRNTKSVPRELLRSRITTLVQDGVELKGSVRFNLFPFAGPKPSNSVITATLDDLGLLNYFQTHGGLDVDIAKVPLSRSQKQLMFLARAILHHISFNTRVIMMDEATSAMDRDADEDLQELMDEIFAGCTVLQIAHQEASFRDINVHMHLENGRLTSFSRRQAQTG